MSESAIGPQVGQDTFRVIEIGRASVRILVPSRRKDGGIVENETRTDWENQARKELETSPFGGATPSQVIGSFVHGDGRVTREKITVLTSSCSAKVLEDEPARERILAFARKLCAALGQECILVNWGDLAILVSETFDLESIPVTRFSALLADSQSKHLTMGWGGIDGPPKVLQVLSLDTWTLPKESDREEVPGQPGLVLRAVLREECATRRAWSWAGDLAELKAARKAWSKGPGPRQGDLVFYCVRAHYVDLVLVTKNGFAGPRDLRLSQGQLNPVTRHLLTRILQRDWDRLERDLDQQPLEQGFFSKLQKLRVGVEEAVRKTATQGAPAARKRAGRQRARQDDEPTAEPKRSPFRTSVLVVGRMMFLRFLAQKGWLPGGVEGLLTAFEKHGDAFFEKHILPLWFDVLNTPVASRAAGIRDSFVGDFPYLNGGLFQPREGEKALRLPGELFDPDRPGSFLQLFRDFEFSLNEHAGSDDSLKIDPSLFGKSLETFNSLEDRKSEGVHYTPKPIAWALALESISERVAQLSGIERERIDGLLRGERNLTGTEAEKVSQVLGGLRIVDPAVGSGVLLWASLEVMLALDSACCGIIGDSEGYRRGSLRWGRQSRHFVCNCLHGVDLSEEAVELTRLRLWLAVALSESEAQPLPDLDLNITRGDSLLQTGGPAQVGRGGTKAKQLSLGLSDRDKLEIKLERLTRKYMTAGETEPAEQRQIRADILEARRELTSSGAATTSEDLPLDWKTFFPHVFRDQEKRGFDVVIANPPYIRIQQVKKSPEGKKYLAQWSTLASGNADLSYAFVELALRDLAAPNGGQVAFIQPNFRHHDAAETLRRMLVGRDPKVQARLRLWVDFDNAQVFPTATNYVALLFAERSPGGPPQAEFPYSNPVATSWMDTEDLDWMKAHHAVHRQAAEGEWLTVPWDLRARVLDAQRRCKQRLGDLAEINVGVQTSADGIYLFEEARDIGDGLLELVPKGGGAPVQMESGAVRRCVKGSAKGEFHLLFPYDGKGKLLGPDVLAKRFPKAWKYLRAHKETLEGREKGKFKGDDWYEFGRRQGYAVSTVPKVIVPSAMRGPVAIVDRDGTMTFTASGKGGGGAWGLVPKKGVSLERLAEVVKAQTSWDHIQVYGSPQQGGWRGVDRQVLATIPV